MFSRNSKRTAFVCVYPPLPRWIWTRPHAPPDDYDTVCRSIWLRAKMTKRALDTWEKLYVLNVQEHSSESSESRTMKREKQKQVEPKNIQVDTTKIQQQQQEQQQQQQQQEQLEQEPLSKESRLYRFYRSDFRQLRTESPAPPLGPRRETETRPEELEAHNDERNVGTQKQPAEQSKPVLVDMDRNTTDKAKASPEVSSSKTRGAAARSSQDDLSHAPRKRLRYRCEGESEPEVGSSSGGERSSSRDSCYLPSIRNAASDSDDSDDAIVSDMEDVPEEKEQTPQHSTSTPSQLHYTDRQKVATENKTKKQIQGPRESQTLPETEQDQNELNADALTEENSFSNAICQKYKWTKKDGLHQENVTTQTENKSNKGFSISAGAQKYVLNPQTLEQTRQAQTTPRKVVLEEKEKDDPEEESSSEGTSSATSSEFPRLCSTVDTKRRAAMKNPPKRQFQGQWEIPLLAKQDEKKKMADPPAHRRIYIKQKTKDSPHPNVTKRTEHRPRRIWNDLKKYVVGPQHQKAAPHKVVPTDKQGDEPKEQRHTFQRDPCTSSLDFPQLCNTVDAKRKATMENPPKKNIQGPWEIPLLDELEQEQT